MTNIYCDNYDKSGQEAPASQDVEAKTAVPLIGPRYPWLAPLAGHTDLVLRVLCREFGTAVACTEMVSAKGLIYGEQNRKGCNATADLLQTLRLPEAANLGRTRAMLTQAAAGFPAEPAADSPLVVQLFGDEAEFLGQAVALLRSWGYDWFDLNLGCSVPKVNKAGAGSALARNLDKTLAAAEEMIRAAGPLPAGLAPADLAKGAEATEAARGRVGFKIRLGWSAAEENYLELARGLEQCGAAWITLHPRHARQGFSGQADWPALEKLRATVQIPVMASGDLFEAEAAVRCLEETGVSGVMFARGALRNPAVFSDYLDLLAARLGSCKANRAEEIWPARRSTSPEFLRAMILRHAELARAMPLPNYGQPGRRAARLKKRERPEPALLKLRGAIPRYVKDLPGSRAFRVAMSGCSSWGMFYELVEAFFAANRSLPGPVGADDAEPGRDGGCPVRE